MACKDFARKDGFTRGTRSNRAVDHLGGKGNAHGFATE